MTALFRTIACVLTAVFLLVMQGQALAKKNPPPAWQGWQQPPAQVVAERPTPAATAFSVATPSPEPGINWTTRLLGLAIGLLSGALVGALCSQRLRTFRRYLLFACLGLVALALAGAGVAFNDLTSNLVGAFVGAIVAWFLLRVPGGDPADTTLGSAKWAELHELQAAGVIKPEAPAGTPRDPGKTGYSLGYIRGKRGRTFPLYYEGERHLLTIAPNRSGKGISAIIPNLLTYIGSSIVIDPKGENAKITALRRGPGTDSIPGMQQKVHILDPWNIARVPGINPSRFNPIDWIVADRANSTENAMLLADSIVPGGDGKEAFWNDEARALLTGFILHVAFDPSEEGRRTLGRCRDMAVMGEAELADLLGKMVASPHRVARSTAERTITKDEKMRANVFTTLQSHTHFLDSPVLRESLRSSDFRFEDLKTEAMTVYLVLPADRLDSFGRWLRILIQQAITVNARNIEVQPKRPILFMLDEMAALGRLAMVERAFGLMAGFGIQLWGIFQDASQAKRIYGDGWETFVGNAGVLQYFGSRDHSTSEYMSKLCGVTTMTKFSLTSALVKPFTLLAKLMGKDHELQPQSTTKDIVQRQLAYPDELMRMRDPAELLFIEGCNPIMANKLAWFNDPERSALGVNLKAEAVSVPPARPAVQPAAPQRPQAPGGAIPDPA